MAWPPLIASLRVDTYRVHGSTSSGATIRAGKTASMRPSSEHTRRSILLTHRSVAVMSHSPSLSHLLRRSPGRGMESTATSAQCLDGPGLHEDIFGPGGLASKLDGIRNCCSSCPLSTPLGLTLRAPIC